uniref:NLP/P60 protein n=1 Tax=Caulobacter sp. (strain K31) TaxID=366602 RepID=B0T643_CAUSK
MIPQEVWEQIKPIFALAYPCEAVVAVMPDLTWRHLENTAADPLRGFDISQADMADLMEEPPLVLLHSHCSGIADPSDLDTLQQMATGWTWGIVAVTGNLQGQVYNVAYPEVWGDEAPIPPLNGRTYLWAIRDCWSYVRDYYRLQGFDVPNVPRYRERSAYPPNHQAHRPFGHFPTLVGFEQVPRSQRQPGDCCTLIVQPEFNPNEPNHCAVYLGNGKYGQQLIGQTSNEWTPQNEELMLQKWSATFYRWKPTHGQSHHQGTAS